MNVIEEITERLKKYPHVRYSVTESSITVHAQEGGFDVSVTIEGSITVGFDGWHEHFHDENDAFNCFSWGLSEECRLAVVRRGSTPVAWTTQSLVDDQWTDDSTTGLMFTPFWRPRSVVYLQNHLIRRRVAE